MHECQDAARGCAGCVSVRGHGSGDSSPQRRAALYLASFRRFPRYGCRRHGIVPIAEVTGLPFTPLHAAGLGPSRARQFAACRMPSSWTRRASRATKFLVAWALARRPESRSPQSCAPFVPRSFLREPARFSSSRSELLQ